MFKIKNRVPSALPSISELADFLEWKCLLSCCGEYSILEGAKSMSIQDDGFSNSIDDVDDRWLNSMNDALQEIDTRGRNCNGNYPFSTSSNRILCTDTTSYKYVVYRYLLLVTRLDMSDKNEKTQESGAEKLDGTLLFEELSSEVARNYLGGGRTKTYTMGTSKKGNFVDKTEDLLAKLSPNTVMRRPKDSTMREKDGGVDLVVWKDFSDKQDSKLICFGQCKTGTSWRDKSIVLPKTFCNMYMTSQPLLEPIPLLFVSETFKDNWEQQARKFGLLFDRCRIMDYLPIGIERTGLFQKIKIWSCKVMEKV